jgi:hypothetical protein
MVIKKINLAQSIQLTNLDSLYLTTFTMDEGVLYSLLRSLGSEMPRDVYIRFDPAGFRGSKPRAVSPKSFQPVFSSNPFDPVEKMNPAIFHPKITLGINNKNARIVISTANIAYNDQERSANINVAFDIIQKTADKISVWFKNVNIGRTVCFIHRQRKPLDLVISNLPTWATFTNLCNDVILGEREWLLAAPFWSISGLKKIMNSSGFRSIKAYFRDQYQAKAIVSSPQVYSKTISCLVPKKGKPFHHKVVACRSIGKRLQCVLYIGSANITSAGFFGATNKKTNKNQAWNYEAGIILIGGKEVWEIAKAAASAGIPEWRKLEVKKRSFEKSIDDEFGPKNEETMEKESILRAHLRSAIRLNGTEVTWMKINDLPGKKLRYVDIELDDKIKRLRERCPIKITKKYKFVCVKGLYQTTNSKHQKLVALELPTLSKEPDQLGVQYTVNYLRQMLGISSKPPSGGGGHGDTGEEYKSWSFSDDIRFPFQELFYTKRKIPEQADRFLDEIMHSCKGKESIGFWRAVAENMPEICN